MFPRSPRSLNATHNNTEHQVVMKSHCVRIVGNSHNAHTMDLSNHNVQIPNEQVGVHHVRPLGCVVEDVFGGVPVVRLNQESTTHFLATDGETNRQTDKLQHMVADTEHIPRKLYVPYICGYIAALLHVPQQQG